MDAHLAHSVSREPQQDGRRQQRDVSRGAGGPLWGEVLGHYMLEKTPARLCGDLFQRR